MTNGTTVLIEFMKDGQNHKTVRWSSCKDTTARFSEIGLWEELKLIYAKAGAEIIQISKIENSFIQIA